MADPVYTFIERQGDSEGLLFTNSLRISLLFTEGQFARFLSSIEKETEQRFFDSYTFIFGYLEQDEKDEILFSIIRQATIDSIGNEIKEYYTFELNLELKGISWLNKVQYLDIPDGWHH